MSLGVLAAVVVTYMLLPHIRNALRFGPPPTVSAEIRLINECAIADSHFAVRNPVTGHDTAFINGLARIDAEAGTFLHLILAREFDDVAFSREKHHVKSQMTLTARCTGGVMQRIGRIFGK